MESLANPARSLASSRADRLGGIIGNERLTAATASVLTVLLAAEGITLLAMGPLLSIHMLVGLVLIPPILLKLGSTGYRFTRYYTQSRPYREKGPPALPMRLLAPVLAVTTVGIFVTGVWLLALGHKSDQMVFFHKLFFFAWAGVFAIHFLVYAPRALRSLASDWGRSSAQRAPGTGLRGMIVAASLGAGIALALTLASAISGWQSG